jgi:hypothetical protein
MPNPPDVASIQDVSQITDWSQIGVVAAAGAGSKIQVLNLVGILSNYTADLITSGFYYDHVLFELARENWFVDASLTALTRGQREVDLGAAVGPELVNRLALIYDDTELEEATKTQMEALDPQWRDAIKYTRSYVTEDENAKVVALHPAPVVASNPNLGSFGEPFGLDLPTRNLAVFYSYAPLPPWQPWYYLELVIALRILALEHLRESDHTDVDFAGACQTLSDLFKGMLV